MKFDRKTLAILFLMFLLSLTGCKASEAEEDPGTVSPTEYLLGEERVAAFVPEEGAVPSLQSGPTVYTYGGLSAPGASVEGYVAQLTAPEEGFTVVDETYRKTETPDFAVPEGTVLLAKDSAVEERVLSVLVSWSADTCTVTVDTPEGKVDASEPRGMTLTEAERHFKELPPAALGLEGESMSEYRVYSLSGAVLVDSTPCLQMNVYCAENPEGTNELMGMYLMSGDGRLLYRLDKDSGTVEKLDQV